MNRYCYDPGVPIPLADGRVVEFMESDIQATATVCEGCIFENGFCSEYEEVGSCGSGRPDGKFGIFVESKRQQ